MSSKETVGAPTIEQDIGERHTEADHVFALLGVTNKWGKIILIEIVFWPLLVLFWWLS